MGRHFFPGRFDGHALPTDLSEAAGISAPAREPHPLPQPLSGVPLLDLVKLERRLKQSILGANRSLSERSLRVPSMGLPSQPSDGRRRPASVSGVFSRARGNRRFLRSQGPPLLEATSNLLRFQMNDALSLYVALGHYSRAALEALRRPWRCGHPSPISCGHQKAKGPYLCRLWMRREVCRRLRATPRDLVYCDAHCSSPSIVLWQSRFQPFFKRATSRQK